ncbi:ChaN family lipoprotein [Kaarinaea lacus]
MWTKKIKLVMGLFGTALLLSCSQIRDDSPANELILKNHPLTQQIWDVNKQDFVQQDDLLKAMLASKYVLLGETHDNPVHHEYQAWAINELSKNGRRISVAYEMISEEKSEVLSSTTFTSSDQLFDLLEWEKTGWPARDMYSPVFDATLNGKYKIVAANIDKDKLKQVFMQGTDAIPKNIKQLVDDNPMDEQSEAVLRKGIIESHCNMLPENMVPTMMLTQRLRDAAIARNVVENIGADGTVLIAGSGHTQKRGVPVFIQALDKDATQLSMGWMEVDERFNSPQEYSHYYSSDNLPFDFVWFTPRIDRPDPCEELKKHHKFKKE